VVEGQQLADPALGDPGGAGGLGLATTLDDNGSDHETGFGHPSTITIIQSFRCLDTTVSDDPRQGFPMS
jgi:hypothetical protein